MLEKYWDANLISRWKTHVFGLKGTEVCQNMITLSPSAHAYWGAALFALKPVSLSKDQKELVVQFFWLRPVARVHRVSLRSRPVLHGDLGGSVSNIKLFNCQTEAKICSGDHITLTTEDPTTMPLPSIDLLEMQWVLHRLTALSSESDMSYWQSGTKQLVQKWLLVSFIHSGFSFQLFMLREKKKVS